MKVPLHGTHYYLNISQNILIYTYLMCFTVEFNFKGIKWRGKKIIKIEPSAPNQPRSFEICFFSPTKAALLHLYFFVWWYTETCHLWAWTKLHHLTEHWVIISWVPENQDLFAFVLFSIIFGYLSTQGSASWRLAVDSR